MSCTGFLIPQKTCISRPYCMWFLVFVTVFNQSYNCQKCHYLGSNRVFRPFLIFLCYNSLVLYYIKIAKKLPRDVFNHIFFNFSSTSVQVLWSQKFEICYTSFAIYWIRINTSCRFFQIFWPSYNILILWDANYCSLNKFNVLWMTFI